MFARLVDVGSSALSELPADRQAKIIAEIASAFRLGFLLVPVFTGIGVILAWTNQARRI